MTNCTMVTANCDFHPLLNRLHNPDPGLPSGVQDKCSLVHVPPLHWAQRLPGSADVALGSSAPPPVEDYDLGHII